MSIGNIEHVLNELRNLDGFANVETHNSEVQRMGGLTNLVYRVKFGGRAVIVRIPGEGRTHSETAPALHGNHHQVVVVVRIEAFDERQFCGQMPKPG